MKTITIGDKPLKLISQEDLLKVVEIEGCLPDFQYWHKPTVTDINNTMFSDTVIISYCSYRKHDGKLSNEFTFYFDHKRLSCHYTRADREWKPNGKRLSIDTIKFLVQNGYDVPIY